MDTIKIMAEPSSDPHKCKFVLEKPLLTGGSFTFKSAAEAKGSALPEAIFNVNGVSEVFVSANAITVTKSSDVAWREIGKDIGGAIRAALTSGNPLVDSAILAKLPSPDEIRKKVLEVLEKEINPSVASHGGFIELLDVKNNDIYVKMGGGCQGCASSTATLKQGVEKAFRNAVPELGSVYDTTDHAAGTNPYFAH